MIKYCRLDGTDIVHPELSWVDHAQLLCIYYSGDAEGSGVQGGGANGGCIFYQVNLPWNLPKICDLGIS